MEYITHILMHALNSTKIIIIIYILQTFAGALETVTSNSAIIVGTILAVTTVVILVVMVIVVFMSTQYMRKYSGNVTAHAVLPRIIYYYHIMLLQMDMMHHFHITGTMIL